MASADTRKRLRAHRRNIKPISVRASRYGTLKFRVLMTLDDLAFLEDLINLNLPAREFTARVIHNQLVTPKLEVETVRDWDDKLLSRSAIAWARHRLTINKQIPSDSPPFEEFKQGVSNCVLEETRKINEAMRALATSMGSLWQEPLQPVMQQIAIHMHNEMEQFGRSLTQAFDFKDLIPKPELGVLLDFTKYVPKLPDFPRLFEGFDKFQEILESAKVDARIISTPLADAHFWITPSASLGLIRRLKQLSLEDGVTAESIGETFVQWYEEDDWIHLKKMAHSWKGNPHFATRLAIIQDALEAHINGKYTLSVAALLPQVEGIAISILRKPGGQPTSTLKEIIKSWNDEVSLFVSKEFLLSFVTSPSGYGGVRSEFFTTQKYTEWLKSKGMNERQTLNRHAILHGVQVKYASKENSLRAFLLLDFLYYFDMRVQTIN